MKITDAQYQIIATVCDQPIAFVKTVINRESGGLLNAYDPGGPAFGLVGFTSSTAAGYGARPLRTPEEINRGWSFEEQLNMLIKHWRGKKFQDVYDIYMCNFLPALRQRVRNREYEYAVPAIFACANMGIDNGDGILSLHDWFRFVVRAHPDPDMEVELARNIPARKDIVTEWYPTGSGRTSLYDEHVHQWGSTFTRWLAQARSKYPAAVRWRAPLGFVDPGGVKNIKFNNERPRNLLGNDYHPSHHENRTETFINTFITIP